MSVRFPAIVTPDTTLKGRNVFIVEFPDCPGCVTQADSEAEILPMAQDALEGWLESRLAHGDAPKRPSLRKPRGASVTWILVPARLAVRLLIRWGRLDSKLSQAQLAARAGVTRQQIAKLEHPDANPTLGTIEKVAAALGMRIEVAMSRNAEAQES